MFIDDIDDAVLRAIVLKFADDTKLAMKIKNEEDAKALQEDLDRISEWAERWEMRFNVDKCKVLHAGTNNPRFVYEMNGKVIEEVAIEKDLGVWMDETLKPAKQCLKAAQSAHFALGQISRSFHFRSKSTLVPLYKCFIRPKMEFAVAAWSPWYEKDTEALEKVQEKLIGMISDIKGNTYQEKLRDAGLTTLKQRRERGDLIEVYKVMKGFTRVNKHHWFNIQRPEESRSTRRNASITVQGEYRRDDMISKEHVRLEIRKHFFTIRVVNRWNELPNEIRKQTSVNSFKNSLDRWLGQNPIPD